MFILLLCIYSLNIHIKTINIQYTILNIMIVIYAMSIISLANSLSGVQVMPSRQKKKKPGLLN